MITKNEAYQAGKAQASHVLSANWGEILRIFDEASTLSEGWDEALDELTEAELGAREFTPFELFAQQLNKQFMADELWAAYEQGVYHGFVEEIQSQVLNLN